MTDSRTPAGRLVDRLRQPQRIGLFGRRGVGKTTLLTLLYREAVGGRLPGIRLAAADPATAAYLADRIRQLEAGQPVPATLDQTELRFHLYADGSRVELVLFDYQGEHVALGRHEAIRDFLRDCDAVLLCLDAALASDPSARWTAEQEVEQLAEDYLAVERPGEPHRPMALVVTRADLLGDAGDVATLRALLDPVLTMTRHTLRTHCPWQGVFAVSSLAVSPDGTTVTPQPVGFDEPLHWLTRAIRAQDEARLERLWQIAAHDVRTIDQATRAFLRRHPDAPSARVFRGRLRAARWRQRRRRLLAATGVLAALLLVAWAYDALGAAALDRALNATDDPAQRRQLWRDHIRWYPTRHLFRRDTLPAERDAVAELDRLLRDHERIDRLATLRKLAADPDGDPEQTWTAFRRFRDDFPDHDLDTPERTLRDTLKAAADARRERLARQTLRDLDRAETAQPLEKLVEEAGRLAVEHAGTPTEADLLRRRTAYLTRIDDRDFEQARDYSTRSPLNFATRREKYRGYLDRHPDGAHAAAARAALAAVARAWDRHDYQGVRDAFLAKPGDLDPLRTRSRAYLAAHPDGQYRPPVAELLRWCDRVSQPSEYRVVLESGSFSKKVAYLLSRGAYLSAEIEVAGVRYGPSTIIPRSYEPEWKYEFPRKVRWKLGDPVRVIVTDHYYWKRRVGDLTFDDDPLAMRHLSGEVELRLGTVTFSSDFTLPRLPAAE